MNIDEQVELLMQGTDYGDEEIKKSMTTELHQRLLDAQKEARPLRVYCGYDPTSTDLHLGHTISMRKLRQFQDLGHEVTFLIGSYTALVGDPSDKNKARPILTEEQVAQNALTYAEQAFRVLDREKTIVRYNGEWLSELSLVDLIRLGQNFTVQQFLARECKAMTRSQCKRMYRSVALTNYSISSSPGANYRRLWDKDRW
jgi:tyrosyl-tRNA synthetase